MSAQLRFDAIEHKYYIGDRELISVTTLLKAMGLVWYPMNEAVKLKMELGTYVHYVTECYDKSKLGLFKLNPENIYKNDVIRKANGLHEALPYFEAYKKFIVEITPEIIEVEQRYHHPQWFYAGTVDRVCKINGQLGILDIKTGIPVPATDLQLGGYGALHQYHKGIMPKGHVLYLKGDGTYKLVEVKEMQFQANTFLSALQTHQWKQAHNIKEYSEYE